MNMRKPKIELNSGELSRFLKNSAEVQNAVDKTAKNVENELRSVVPAEDAAHQQTMSRDLREVYDARPSQIIYNEKGEPTDRYRREVGVENARNSDFVRGTVQQATSNVSKRERTPRKPKR